MTPLSVTPRSDPSLGRDESSYHRLLRDEFDGLRVTEECKTEEKGPLCDLCEKGHHMSSFCPYLRHSVPDRATVGKGWMIRCWHCNSKKIDPVLKACLLCGNTRKRAVPLVCAICNEYGHRYKTCQYVDQMPPGHYGYYRPVTSPDGDEGGIQGNYAGFTDGEVIAILSFSWCS